MTKKTMIIIASLVLVVGLVSVIIFVSSSRNNTMDGSGMINVNAFEELEYNYGGGELGDIYTLRISEDTLEYTKCEGNGSETISKTCELDEDIRSKISELLEDGKVRSWTDLEKSDIFADDAATVSFKVTFADDLTIRVGSNDILPSEGWDTIDEIVEILDDFVPKEKSEAGNVSENNALENGEYDNGAVFLDGLVVDWADERKSDLSDYEEIDIATGEYAAGILFIANEYIDEFKLYELQMTSVDTDGKPVFSRKTVYGPEPILEEMPLVFNVEFPGDMSAYGFTYSYNGMDRSYSIMVSGMDGSLVIDEINFGYPDDDVTIPFTKEYEYDPENYTNLSRNESMSEDDIDNLMEYVGDMLSVYQSDNDSNEYEDANGNSVSQEFFQDEYYGTRVTHSILWSDNEIVDSVMKKVGYKEYEVNYYYPFGAWVPAGEYEVKPVYACLYVDGNGYEYYFWNDELVRREGPEGTSINPQVNDFINSIYKIGCYYGNTLVGEKNRYNLMVSSFDGIEKKDNCFVLNGSILGRNDSGSFIVDEKTVFDDEVEEFGFQGLEDGESFYDWYTRAYDAIENQEDWIEFSALMGIWDLKTTNGHVDSVCGTYWWD